MNQEVYRTLNNPGNAIVRTGLERVKQVLAKLGNPQNNYKIIHITGSNGKGSTAEFLSSGLIHAGYKVGKYTSPYIHMINESINLDHIDISDKNLEIQFYKVKQILVKYNLELSPFEYLTVIMFNYFAMCEIDYLVLEVGMGGLDDATNVVDSIFTIITNISLEHTNYLGTTLAEIAQAKCGIIKNGMVIIADNTAELTKFVKSKAKKHTNVLVKYRPQIVLDHTNFKTKITFIDMDSDRKLQARYYELSLFGDFQANNFLCAYEVFKQLDINDASIKYAAENTYNKGRFEVVGREPIVVYDASHNLAGVKGLVNSIIGKYNPDNLILVVAILKDKEIEAMLMELSKISHHIICTTILDNPRAISADELRVIAQKYFVDTIAINDANEALLLAKSLPVSFIIVTGSIYLLSTFDRRA